MNKQKLMDKFHAMVKAKIPIVGGGAGTGLSAKCEELGGIDMIVDRRQMRKEIADLLALLLKLPTDSVV